MAGPTSRPKCSHACNFCRAKKAKCSGVRPCNNCTDHGEECVYPEIQARFRKRKSREKALDERFERLEAALQATLLHRGFPQPDHQMTINSMGLGNQEQGFNAMPPPGERFSPVYEASVRRLPENELPTTQQCFARTDDSFSGVQTNNASIILKDMPNISPSPAMDAEASCSPKILNKRIRTWRDDTPSNARTVMGVPTPPSTTIAEDASSNQDTSSNELPRPNTYLSICSEGAIDWVTHEKGIPDFITTARRLTADVMRHEKLQQAVGQDRAPEPDFPTAMKWTVAFFEEGLDSVYGVVHRAAFETRLRHHFQTNPQDQEDTSWYALRNTVYASGCRLVLSDDGSPASFTAARTQAWRYYENALSVHTELIYSRCDTMAVQALLFMAFFAEALGSPALEFMLLSNATRLAQSKGMHLQLNTGKRAKEEDVQLRQWLWWCIYSYDKHMSYRSGRPSMIDDDDISCQIPTKSPAGSTINACFFQNTIKHAQISSKIAKRLGTVKAMQQTPEQTLDIVQELEGELMAWRQSLPPEFRSNPPFRNIKLPSGIQLFHIIFLHFSYYGSLIAIHTVFCYPWNRPGCEKSQNPAILQQRQRSTETVAEASRNVIMAAQRLQISAASPVWLTFYFPLIGLINLFVYVLKYPHLPTVHSDISLMDVVVGHFGYLEYASASELQFPFPRELVGYARNVVRRSRETSISRPNVGESTYALGPEQQELPLNDHPLPELFSSELDDFHLEDWPSFLPSFSGVSYMMLNGPPQPQEVDLILGQL